MMVSISVTIPHWLIYGAVVWFLIGCLVVVGWHLVMRPNRHGFGVDQATDALIAVLVWPYAVWAATQTLKSARRRGK